MARTRWSIVVAVVAALGLAGCGAAESLDQSDLDPVPSAGDRLKVVTTVAPITDIVARVAGGEVDVVGIVPAGTNSHTFEPGPSVAREVSEARLFIANGLFLEEPSIQLAQANLPADGEIITLADRVVDEDEWVFDFSFPAEEGLPNPHLWTSPPLATQYAEIVADELSRVDPAGAEGYRQRFVAFADQVTMLDQAIMETVATVPRADRKLVTYHDSFPYFAPRYGFEIIAAIQPSDFSEPSAAEMARLIDQIRAEQVPAIFGSEVFPSDALSQIAAETGAAYVEDLRDDELPGAPGDPEHSYVGMMVFNVRTIVEALGGDATALDALDLRG